MKLRCWRYKQSHISFSLLFMLFVLAVPGAAGANRLHHQLHVTLTPAQSHVSVVDDIQFPVNTRTDVFSPGSSLTLETPGIEHEILGVSSDGRSRHYRINRLPAQGKVQLVYQGNISTQGTRGPFDMPDALLGPEGVFLDGSSRWIPRFIDYPWYTFKLNVIQPSGWELINQGKRSRRGEHVSFDMMQPQDDIYLLGGPYRRYARTHQGVEIVVYLFDDDADLAGACLDVSADYISRKPLGLIGEADPAEIALMGRKLPHYSSYGVLVFIRSGADNILKRHLQAKFSPMMRELPD